MNDDFEPNVKLARMIALALGRAEMVLVRQGTMTETIHGSGDDFNLLLEVQKEEGRREVLRNAFAGWGIHAFTAAGIMGRRDSPEGPLEFLVTAYTTDGNDYAAALAEIRYDEDEMIAGIEPIELDEEAVEMLRLLYDGLLQSPDADANARERLRNQVLSAVPEQIQIRIADADGNTLFDSKAGNEETMH